jgi:hypothetical protein
MPIQNVVIIIEAGRRLSDYASVTVPTLLIVGGKTRAPARAVFDMLSATCRTPQ